MDLIGASTRLFGVVALAGTAFGQWTTQQIPLQPGWNAVYLEVEPADGSLDDLLGGTAVETVWQWNREFSTVEFDQDPNTKLFAEPHWLNWLPPDHPESFLRNLQAVRGGMPYLVKVDPAAPAFVWSVVGRPAAPTFDWLAGKPNFVGFPLKPGTQPTYGAFFAHTADIEVLPQYGGDVREILPDGRDSQIRVPAYQRMQPGRAWWVKPKAVTDFTGVIEVSPTSLDFRADFNRGTLRLANRSETSTLTLSLRALASESPPAGEAALAGPVPLMMEQTDPATATGEWVDLPDPYTVTLDPGAETNLDLAVKRSALAPYAGATPAAYQCLLEVTDSAGLMRRLVPVTAEVAE